MNVVQLLEKPNLSLNIYINLIRYYEIEDSDEDENTA